MSEMMDKDALLIILYALLCLCGFLFGWTLKGIVDLTEDEFGDKVMAVLSAVSAIIVAGAILEMS